MLETVLEVNDLNVWYRSGTGLRKQRHQVLHDVSFTLYRGEILGLVGESGSGKSTLARAVLGMESDITGTVIHHTKRPQMVFQDPYSSLNPAFTIRRIVEEPLRIYGKHPPAERRKRAEEMLEAVGLGPEFHDRKPGQLSGGQPEPRLYRGQSAGRAAVYLRQVRQGRRGAPGAGHHGAGGTGRELL